MEIKHTPGPWDTNGLRIWAKFAYSESQVFELATMSHFAAATERIANAYLMIASPDMLTALETVLAGGHLNTGEQAIVANAIAKATGRDVADVVKGARDEQS